MFERLSHEFLCVGEECRRRGDDFETLLLLEGNMLCRGGVILTDIGQDEDMVDDDALLDGICIVGLRCFPPGEVGGNVLDTTLSLEGSGGGMDARSRNFSRNVFTASPR